jgi:hypothetical protein
MITFITKLRRIVFPDKDSNMNQEPVVYAYNHSYSGGRDQEDCGSKPLQANSS